MTARVSALRHTRSLLMASVLFLATLIPAAANDSDGDFKSLVKPFLTTYCVQCHGAKVQKGQRRFDRLRATIRNDDTLVDHQDILDQLNLGAMPPEDAKQPSDRQRGRVIEWFTSRLQQYHENRRSSRESAVLRRLNSREYRNTIRDLLRLDMTIFDPTRKFPRDQTSEHLDNIGETLITSGHLLERYLDAADTIVDKALWPIERPPVQTWTFRDGFRQQPEIDQVHVKTNGFEHMTLYDVVGADKHEGAYGPILAFADGVPFDGTYEIRIKAEAVNREHPYDPEFLGTDPGEPLRLGIVPGNRLAGNLHLPQPVEPLLAEIDLADEAKWYTVRVRLDKGFTPRFTFRNGLMDVRNLWNRVIRKYPDQFPEDVAKGIVAARFNAIKHGKLPQIHIHEIEIEGPIYDRWPRDSQRVLLGDEWDGTIDDNSLDEKRMRSLVRAFASRAFRRPARDDEVDRVMRLIAIRQAVGRSPLQSFADGIKSVLCSPAFLYLEKSDETPEPLALASRLSYFLWSSMPDETLIRLASSGELADRQLLQQQTERMLGDPRSDAFVSDFLDSWLGLRELGSSPPDRSEFRDFYHYDLDASMRRETFLFTRHLLDENEPLGRFLDADYAFVDRPLARLYGLPRPADSGFQKVALTDSRRGGLLGQASILTLTANGIDTSPVVRGVWLLEHLLGTPPSPPPPDVEPLDPDTRGATTIRDQLEKHRSVASCNECHRKIDPLGFALENFDPIGRWRANYGRNNPIDASGELPDGRQFTDVRELKEILVEQQDQFAHAVTVKLLSYAIGRHIGPADRPHVDAIVDEAAANGYRFRDLVKSVVLSELFRSK